MARLVRALCRGTCGDKWPEKAGIGVKIGGYDVRPLLLRHGRAWPGHPRLAVPNVGKSWMAGIKPAMTRWERPCRLLTILTPMRASPGQLRRCYASCRGRCERSEVIS